MTGAGRTEIAGYQIIRPLGTGGMGEVFLVQNPTLPRHEALKLLDGALSRDQEFRARFNREAELLAGLNHPNVVTLLSRGETDGLLWLTMEYVDGVDCAQLVRMQGPMPVDMVVAIISGVAAALDYAYLRRGITHRDVKPANIMVTFHEGRIDEVKLADFGIAKAAGESTNLTSTGLTIGTMAYISPEAITDSGNITGAADQYSLAATAYALLTGAGPFTSAGAPALMYDHLNTPAAPITSRRPDLPSGLDVVLLRALSKKPEDRHPTCTEFAEAVKAAASSPPVGSVVASAPIPLSADDLTLRPGLGSITPPFDPRYDKTFKPATNSPRGSRRNRLYIAGAALVVAVIVAIGTLALVSNSAEPAVANSTAPSYKQQPMVAATVSVGNRPGAVAIAPDSKTAYVPNNDDGTLSVIDSANKTVIATIPVGRSPGDVLVSPNGEAVYVLNLDDDSVSVVDTARNAVVATIPVGRRPGGSAIDARGAVLYVTSLSDGVVSVIDTKSRKVSATIPVGKSSWGVAMSPTTPSIYVANSDDGTVSVVDTVRNRVSATIRVGREPKGIVVPSPDGATVYVPNLGDGTLSVISTATNSVAATIPIGEQISGVAVVSGNGAVLVAFCDAFYNGKVSVIDSGTNTIKTTFAVGTTANGVTVSPNGSTAYVPNGGNGTVSVIDTASNRVTANLTVGEAPYAVAIAPTGNLVYVNNGKGSNVSVISAP